jgi:hypothetical protein
MFREMIFGGRLKESDSYFGGRKIVT